MVKNYKIEHSIFYEMLKSELGTEKLAYLIHTISFLLNKVADIGALYGNLRTENIILILD